MSLSLHSTANYIPQPSCSTASSTKRFNLWPAAYTLLLDEIYESLLSFIPRLIIEIGSRRNDQSIRDTQPVALIQTHCCENNQGIGRWHHREQRHLSIAIIEPKSSLLDLDAVYEPLSQAILYSCLPQYTLQQVPCNRLQLEQGKQLMVALTRLEAVNIGHTGKLTSSGLACLGGNPNTHHGYLLSLDLDRILMLRKGIPDMRLLHAPDPLIQQQMQHLQPWRMNRRQPKVERDLSLILSQGEHAESINQAIRQRLGDQVEWLEEVKILSKTPYQALPQSAQQHLGMAPEHCNVLLRLVLRHPYQRLSLKHAHQLCDQIYQHLNQGRLQVKQPKSV